MQGWFRKFCESRGFSATNSWGSLQFIAHMLQTWRHSLRSRLHVIFMLLSIKYHCCIDRRGESGGKMCVRHITYALWARARQLAYSNDRTMFTLLWICDARPCRFIWGHSVRMVNVEQCQVISPTADRPWDEANKPPDHASTVDSI